MSEDKKPTCFWVIMPITTPESMTGVYRDGEDHFKHVLDWLLVPSIEKAGYEPIRPKAKGADLIHAEIIKNLETADVVLCDVSCLNANVFFELGIRTSLNKPVCIVKDEWIKKIPFDTGGINHEDYDSNLYPWVLEKDISKLAQHLKESVKRSNGQNTLWKVFAMQSQAKPYEGTGNTDEKVDMLALQVQSLVRKLDEGEPSLAFGLADKSVNLRYRRRESQNYIASTLASHGIKVRGFRWQGPDAVTVALPAVQDKDLSLLEWVKTKLRGRVFSVEVGFKWDENEPWEE